MSAARNERYFVNAPPPAVVKQMSAYKVPADANGAAASWLKSSKAPAICRPQDAAADPVSY
jgi:hypothetical protein